MKSEIWEATSLNHCQADSACLPGKRDALLTTKKINIVRGLVRGKRYSLGTADGNFPRPKQRGGVQCVCVCVCVCV